MTRNAGRRPGVGAALAAMAMMAAQPASARDDAPLKISSAQAARGTQQVVIGAFNVGFLFESIDRTRAAGGMIGAFGGPSRAKSVLQGVTPAMMQAITDAAYADFTGQLAARGFTVIDSAAMFAGDAFARAKPIAAPLDANVALEKKSNGKTSFYKPTALSRLVMLPGDVTPSGMSGIGLSMQFASMQSNMAQYARSTGHAVLDIVYLIDFSDARRPGAFSFGGVKVTSGMSVAGDFSKLSLVAPTGKLVTIVLNDPIAVEGDFATKADETRDKGLQTAGNILGGLAAVGGLGGMRFGKSRTYAFTAKPEAYQQGATKAATLANTRLTEALAGLR